LQIAALEAKYINYLECPLLLRLEFKGHVDAQRQNVTIPGTTKYFPLKIRNITMRVSGSGSVYTCEAIPWNEKAHNTTYSQVKTEVNAAGSTVQEMIQTGAMLGGEQSVQILCRHYGISGDGLLTALHLTALVPRSGYSMSQLREQSFSTYPQLLKNLRVEDRERRCNWQHFEPLQKAIAKAETAMGNQGRILVRASGTEPLIRVMVEAINADIAHYWSDNLVSAVQQYL
jgi:phosphomannomutase